MNTVLIMKEKDSKPEDSDRNSDNDTEYSDNKSEHDDDKTTRFEDEKIELVFECDDKDPHQTPQNPQPVWESFPEYLQEFRTYVEQLKNYDLLISKCKTKVICWELDLERLTVDIQQGGDTYFKQNTRDYQSSNKSLVDYQRYVQQYDEILETRRQIIMDYFQQFPIIQTERAQAMLILESTINTRNVFVNQHKELVQRGRQFILTNPDFAVEYQNLQLAQRKIVLEEEAYNAESHEGAVLLTQWALVRTNTVNNPHPEIITPRHKIERVEDTVSTDVSFVYKRRHFDEEHAKLAVLYQQFLQLEGNLVPLKLQPNYSQHQKQAIVLHMQKRHR